MSVSAFLSTPVQLEEEALVQVPVLVLEPELHPTIRRRRRRFQK